MSAQPIAVNACPHCQRTIRKAPRYPDGIGQRFTCATCGLRMIAVTVKDYPGWIYIGLDEPPAPVIS